LARRVDVLRAFALSLPGAVEDFPWETRVAKVRGKIFVFLGGEAITVKLDESHAHAIAIEGAEPTGYGLGRAGWVNVPVRAPGVTLDLLRDLVEESYLIVAASVLSR
jgi:predicted DNA-binding protein (MmcQ/YjbR family)